VNDLPPSSTAADEDAAATASAASEIRDETSNDTSGERDSFCGDDDRARLRRDLDGGAKAKTPLLAGTARSKTSKDIIVWIVGERGEKRISEVKVEDATSQEGAEDVSGCG
jgi:hypothetical protein